MELERPTLTPELPQQRAEACPLGPGAVLSQRYYVEQIVGQGTFGWVFVALDLEAQPPRQVAIKLLRHRHAALEAMVRRFERRELELLRRVQDKHPSRHVVQPLEPELRTHEGLPYLVLEFINGPSLRERMDSGPLEPEEARRLGAGIARGLAAIHAAGGVHRDLKPANIRLRYGSEPVIVDLGLTRALWETQDCTETGLTPMTPRYASPEQLLGKQVSPASDLYSLGVILLELLTGEVPLATERSQQFPDRRSTQRTPAALVECTRNCLAHDPQRRPSAREVAVLLATPPPDSQAVQGRQWVARAGAALLTLAGLSFNPTRDEPTSRHEALQSPPTWSRHFGNGEGIRTLYSAPDALGNVFVGGGFRKSLRLGGDLLTSSGLYDVFLAKLDSHGQTVWSRRYGDAGWQAASSIAVDPSGNLFVLGEFDGILDFGGQPLSNFAGRDVFLARLDPEGRLLWSQRFGDLSDQMEQAMAIDPEGNVVVTGAFHGRMDLGGGELASAGLTDIFLARFTPDGRLLWSQRFGDNRRQSPTTLAVDRTGRIVLSGWFEGTLDLGGGPLTSQEELGYFVAMFDAQGRHLWSRSVGEPGDQSVTSVRFDTTGQIILLKVVSGAQPRSAQILVTRLTPDGTINWRRPLGTFEHTPLISGIQHAPDGRLIVSGTIQGSADFGDGPFSGLGGKDLFLLEISPEGKLLRTRRFGDAAEQENSVLAVDTWGNLLFTGLFEGTLDLGDGLLTSQEGQELFIARVASPAPPMPLSSSKGTCLPPPPGVAARYPFDSTDPRAAEGTAPKGQLTGEIRFTAGRGGQVLRLDRGYFQVPDADALDVGGSPFSLSAWVRTVDTESTRVIVDKRREPQSGGFVTGYSLFLHRGRLALQLADGAGPQGCVAEGDGSCTNYHSGWFIADGAWHLVSVTVDRTAPQGGTFYVDGVEVSHFDPTLRAGSLDNDWPLRVGSRSSSETGHFRGLIDEVALWKRVLTPEEIANLYSVGQCQAQSSALSRSP